MERYTVFLDCKNPYCQIDYTTYGMLQLQCNSYQITNGFFTALEKKLFLIFMETKRTLNSQKNLEKENWSWRNQAP